MLNGFKIAEKICLVVESPHTANSCALSNAPSIPSIDLMIMLFSADEYSFKMLRSLYATSLKPDLSTDSGTLLIPMFNKDKTAVI